jgi:cytidyltransferase-like protein
VNKYYSFNELLKKIPRKKKIIFVHGIFDILHKGHIILFSEAKKLGDILVVGLDHDDTARILKGNERPINKFNARMFVISHIEEVDYIFKIPSIKGIKDISGFYRNIYQKLSPDIVATCINAGKYGKDKKKQADLLNIKFVNIPKIYKPNTSDVINRLK